jgi:3D (Asp-Asp-Asp) domain-containing protein
MIVHASWKKGLVTVAAVLGFVCVYEITLPDSGAVGLADPIAPPKPGAALHFTATAYCTGEITASGIPVRPGIAAADPELLPAGTVVELSTRDRRHRGIWTIMDTGAAVQGRIVDLYFRNCNDARLFGRRAIQLSVLRLGWNPRDSAPGRADQLFRRRETDRAKMLLPS